MLIEDLRKLIVEESPCKEGLEWFDKVSRGHVNTTTFFNSLKKIKKNTNPFSPHAYLRWIFYKCIDWTEVIKNDILYYQHVSSSQNYKNFIYKNFRVSNIINLSPCKLCNILIQAFENEE